MAFGHGDVIICRELYKATSIWLLSYDGCLSLGEAQRF